MGAYVIEGGDAMKTCKHCTRQAIDTLGLCAPCANSIPDDCWYPTGYQAEIEGRGLHTIAAVEQAHPTWTMPQIDLYLNGTQDAQSGDTFRLTVAP